MAAAFTYDKSTASARPLGGRWCRGPKSNARFQRKMPNAYSHAKYRAFSTRATTLAENLSWGRATNTQDAAFRSTHLDQSVAAEITKRPGIRRRRNLHLKIRRLKWLSCLVLEIPKPSTAPTASPTPSIPSSVMAATTPSTVLAAATRCTAETVTTACTAEPATTPSTEEMITTSSRAAPAATP